MPVSRDMLVTELRDLLRLTAVEQAVATVRRAQAASSPIEQELAANARKAGERLALLDQSLRQVAGVTDVVGPLLGRVGALVQAQLNQVQTLQGALLGDLALEHQLRERARYARTLAVSLGESSVVPVLDRLDAAHTETITWLEERLAEVARTGTSAIRATPVQAVVGTVRKVSGVPFALAVEGVNRVGGLVGRFTRRAPEALSSAADQVIDLTQQAGEKAAETANDVAGTTGQVVSLAADRAADAATQAGEATSSAAEQAGQAVSSAAEQTAGQVADTAEQVADTVEQAAEKAEQVTHEVLEQTGGDDVAAAKPPFAGYERLTGDSVMRHVADTEDVAELRTLLAFEQAHKARKGVLSATQERLTALSSNA